MSKQPYTVDGGCWIWTGSRKTNGTPRIKRDGRWQSPIRYYYQEHHNVTLAPRQPLIKTCSTENCVNPEHHRERNSTDDAIRSFTSWCFNTVNVMKIERQKPDFMPHATIVYIQEQMQELSLTHEPRHNTAWNGILHICTTIIEYCGDGELYDGLVKLIGEATHRLKLIESHGQPYPLVSTIYPDGRTEVEYVDAAGCRSLRIEQGEPFPGGGDLEPIEQDDITLGFLERAKKLQKGG